MNKANYFIMIVMCFITGGLSCLLGGKPAIIYGAIMSAGLASVIPVVNNMKQRGSWNIKRQVIAGGIAGLIIGLIIYAIARSYPALHSHGAWDRSPLILLGAPTIYGIMVHLGHALYCHYKTGKIIFFLMVYCAFSLGGFIGLLPLVFSPEILLLIFLAPWFNCFLFAILWATVVVLFDPMRPAKNEKGSIPAELCLPLQALWFMAILGCFSAMQLNVNYKDDLFLHQNRNKNLLKKANGVIYAGEALRLPEDTVIQQEPSDILQHFPLSPRGDKKAKLKYTDKHNNRMQVIISDNTGKELLKTGDSYLNCGICWHPSGDSVIATQEDNGQYLLKRIFLNGRVENFDIGAYPRLAEETGDIAFVRDGWLYLRKADSNKAEKKRILQLDLNTHFSPVFDYDISPDARLIVANVRT